MIEGLGFNPTQCGSFCTTMGFCISILEDIALIADIKKKHRDGTTTKGDFARMTPRFSAPSSLLQGQRW